MFFNNEKLRGAGETVQMTEEEIRCCINIATLDKELPYKKLLKR